DADAPEHDRERVAYAGRGERRRQRDLRRHGRHHAQRRDVRRQVPRRRGVHDVAHRGGDGALPQRAARGEREGADAEAQDAPAVRGRRQGGLADRAGPAREARDHLEPDRRDRADLLEDPLPRADRRAVQRPTRAAADDVALRRDPPGDVAADGDVRARGRGRPADAGAQVRVAGRPRGHRRGLVAGVAGDDERRRDPHGRRPLGRHAGRRARRAGRRGGGAV
ncbi:MAG: Pyruvate kinase, partial [uncultured Sphingomonadaceae bacterium]